MSGTAGELAKYLGAALAGDAHVRISGVASPEKARPEHLIYVDSAKQLERAKASAARCVLVSEGVAMAGKTTLAVKEPKLAFAKAAEWIAPRETPSAGIHPTAVVASSAKVSASAHIGPYVVVEEDAAIGEGAVIEAFCFVGRGARVGESCRLHPHVTLYAESKLGRAWSCIRAW